MKSKGQAPGAGKNAAMKLWLRVSKRPTIDQLTFAVLIFKADAFLRHVHAVLSLRLMPSEMITTGVSCTASFLGSSRTAEEMVSLNDSKKLHTKSMKLLKYSMVT